jgi:hypothetical protein
VFVKMRIPLVSLLSMIAAMLLQPPGFTLRSGHFRCPTSRSMNSCMPLPTVFDMGYMLGRQINSASVGSRLRAERSAFVGHIFVLVQLEQLHRSPKRRGPSETACTQ